MLDVLRRGDGRPRVHTLAAVSSHGGARGTYLAELSSHRHHSLARRIIAARSTAASHGGRFDSTRPSGGDECGRSVSMVDSTRLTYRLAAAAGGTAADRQEWPIFPAW